MCVQLGAVLLGLGLVGTGLVLLETDNVDTDFWHVVAAVACLSLAWLPSWQHYISTASHSKPHRGGLTGGSATVRDRCDCGGGGEGRGWDGGVFEVWMG